MSSESSSPRLLAVRTGAATAVLLWLAVFLQVSITNQLGFAPGLWLKFFLPIGIGMAVAGAAVGALFQLVARLLGGVLAPRIAAGLAAITVLGVCWVLFAKNIGHAFDRYAAVLQADTTMALGLTGVASVVYLVIGLKLETAWIRLPIACLLGLALSPLVERDQYGAVERASKTDLDAQLHISEGPDGKLLIFGVDGLSWNVLRAMTLRGELPNLARILDEGVHSEMETMIPTLSPIIWNTLATGWDWTGHGVREFASPKFAGANRTASVAGCMFKEFGKNRIVTKASGMLNLMRTVNLNSSMRIRRAFWDVFDQAGVSCSVVGWYGSHPVPAELSGAYLSDEPYNIGRVEVPTDVALYEFSVSPEPLRDFAAALGASEEMRAKAEGYLNAIDFQHEPERKAFEWRLYRALRRAEVCKEMIRNHDSQVYALYTRLVDDAEHLYWIFYEPDHPAYAGLDIDPAQIERLKDVIEHAYRITDDYLGELLAEFDGEVTVAVVSDHSSHAERPPLWVSDPTKQKSLPHSGKHEDAPPGVFLLHGPGVRQGAKIDSRIYDFVPTLAYGLGIPVAENLTGVAREEAFTDAFRAAYPKRSVPTWELEGLLRPAVASLPTQTAEQRRALEELGYVND